jgi:hypothetical protein
VNKEDKSSFAEKDISFIEISTTSRTSQLIRSITSKTLSRNKKSSKKLIKILSRTAVDRMKLLFNDVYD